ncbi:phosphomannomutase [Motilibacter peucedani]|uniref:Phosphomannomutase n=1 Tax=Motilibacter peucedani TaxID=598650 RepID=A0A420XMH1_9ACTN|nr:phospho-sugar mutase [Motilibacter peucedani]RKS71520.1 phosphomannomutase [Motilibacter peucedani]
MSELPATSDESQAGDQQRMPDATRNAPDRQPEPREHRHSEDTVDVTDLAQAWLSEDPDPVTRAELQALLAAPDPVAALSDRFQGSLEFGTAGLRGEVGVGPNRMNRLVVTRATAGLVAYLRLHGGRSVVIGYDARNRSADFARDAASVVAGAGLEALLLPGPLPTPVLAFAVRHLGASAGVMVTASHNPAADNGYKVYLGDGSLIVPPADVEISREIKAVGPYFSIPRAETWTTLGDDVVDAYVARAVSVLDPATPRDLVTVYTPMHGVGGAVSARAVAAAGFPAPQVVSAQAEPDPEFPTVSFPNPEEPGALDLLLELAREHSADLAVANDPDADRLAVAVPDRNGTWRALTGDELGALLATHLLRRGRVEGGSLASSLVSSSLLGTIAAAAGVGYSSTLTGFKWISKVPALRFGYEEALGYCVDPEGVKDKDGISATLVALEMAAVAKAAGRTLLDELDDLYRAHGVHLTGQVSLRFTDLSRIGAAVERLRAEPPESLGGLTVTGVDDLSRGVDGLPPTDGLRFRLQDGARVIVRPSGTEPKVKAYLEVVRPVEGDDVAAAVAAATEVRSRLADGVRALLA